MLVFRSVVTDFICTSGNYLSIKYLLLSYILLNLLIPLITCAVFPRQNHREPLKLEIERVPVNRNLFKRDDDDYYDYYDYYDDDDETHANYTSSNGYLFLTYMYVGTPSQAIRFLLDTDSSDIWLLDSNSTFCKSENGTANIDSDSNSTLANETASRSDAYQCKLVNVFYPEDSSSFVSNDLDFHVQYEDYSYANGTWSQDTFSFGYPSFYDVNIALVSKTNLTVGSLGLGLRANQATNQGDNPFVYNSLLYRLKTQGWIEKIAYSVYTSELNGTGGGIFFGGLYHDLYKGNVIYTLPLVNVDPELDESARFHITLQNLTTFINGTNSSVLSEKYPALLSTGSMFTYLPEELFDSFVDEMDLEKGGKAQGSLRHTL